MRLLPCFLGISIFLGAGPWIHAEEGAKSVEELAAQARDSVVVIAFAGRDGKKQGLGTGFVVDDKGLIATNLHVIGEARPISVQLADGSRHEVTEIHASDRARDLAVIRIAAKNLKALPLGDARNLKQGQAIVALGHPQGLRYSVVSGVLSGQRDVEGFKMLQLAIPIEQGNSGGPVLDQNGRVLGIVTMKSLVTANLGFAVPVNALQPLLAKPNPILMERWLTIGALDPTEWKTVMGGRWRQRAGRIIGDGQGSGFGGRTLCLSQKPAPKGPFELAVSVKLDDEAGAAGLVFASDGDDRHYGFYPSGGKFRLTRFNGPDVFSWKILQEFPSEHYRPGDWNTIKVRLEKEKIFCFVNDHQVLEMEENGLKGKTVGLCKFRETVAEFKNFRLAEKIPSSQVSPDLADKITKKINPDQAFKPAQIDALVPEAPAAVTVLRDRALQLERQAENLRKLAQTVHQQKVIVDIGKVMQEPEDKADLLQAALLIARLDNEEVEVGAYRQEVDRLAREIQVSLPKNAEAGEKIKALNRVLFEERGFHGSRMDYYTKNNSYLNEVLDDREGLPITLSVLYMELGRRLGLKVVGVPLPGHFVVRHEGEKGPGQLIDVYDGGKILSREEAGTIVQKITGQPLEDRHLEAASKKAIVVRMLHNLMNLAQSDRDRDGVLRYLDAILGVEPGAHEERWARAVFRFQAGEREGSLEDVERLLRDRPEEVDLNRVRELKRLLTQPTE